MSVLDESRDRRREKERKQREKRERKRKERQEIRDKNRQTYKDRERKRRQDVEDRQRKNDRDREEYFDEAFKKKKKEEEEEREEEEQEKEEKKEDKNSDFEEQEPHTMEDVPDSLAGRGKLNEPQDFAGNYLVFAKPALILQLRALVREVGSAGELEDEEINSFCAQVDTTVDLASLDLNYASADTIINASYQFVPFRQRKT